MASGRFHINKKRALGRAFLFGFLLATTCNTASAGTVQPNPAQVEAYEKASEGARVKLLIALAKQGQHELADTLLQRYPLTDRHARNRTLYIEGLILMGRKNNKGAVAKFRAALADDPKLTLVRTELAQVLVAMGEDDSAKHHLQQLEADAPDAQAASNIRAFIDRIDQNRPYRFSTYLSLAPSTNINNGSYRNTTTVYSIENNQWVANTGTVSSKQKSGVGLGVGAQAAYTKRMSQNWLLTGAIGGSARKYLDKSFDSFGISQSLDLRYVLNGASVGLGMTGSQSFYNDFSGVSFHSFGPRISATANLSPRDEIAETIRFEKRLYPDAKGANGWAAFIDMDWTHHIAAGSSTTASLGYERVHSGFNTYSYKTWYTGFEFYKELPLGITTNWAGRAQITEFDEYNPLGQDFRKDKRLIGSLGIVKRDWNVFGFAPSAEVTYVKNFSNFGVYDYQSLNLDLRLTKDF